MRRTCLTLFIIAAFAAPSIAQVGFEGGVNLSNMAIKSAGEKISTKFLVGETVGMFFDIPLNDEDHFFLEPGLFYQTNGTTINIDPKWKYVINAGNFPLYFEYKTGDHCSQRVFLGLGPYIGYNMDDGTQSLVVENLGLGLAANIGYVGHKHWYARLHYQMGLINEFPGGDSDNSIKQSCASLTIGYMVRGCKTRSTFGYRHGRSSNHWRGIKKLRNSSHNYKRHIKGPASY